VAVVEGQIHVWLRATLGMYIAIENPVSGAEKLVVGRHGDFDFGLQRQ